MGDSLGIRQDRRISDTRLETIKHSRDPAARRQATYAINARESVRKGRTPKDHAKRLYGAKSNG